MSHITREIQAKFNRVLTDPEDLQALRLAIESAKLQLTYKNLAQLNLQLKSFTNVRDRLSAHFKHTVSRETFEDLNRDLFKKVLEPIAIVLKETELKPEDVHEVVLVGGSTRIPKVRQMIREYFSKEPNVSIDPELAVVSGVSIQAGIIGGVWPLLVSATELPTRAKKIHVR